MNTDAEYGIEKQKLLIETMLAEESIFQRCHNILRAKYFDKELQPVVNYMLKHARKYNSLPTTKQIYAETKVHLSPNDEVRETDHNWALESVETFCRRGAIVQAVWSAPDHIEKGNYGAVEELVKKAVTVGLQKDLGIDYFLDPRERLERMRMRNLIPTGWDVIDKKLYGGLNRGELTIFTAGSGMGKSLFLQNLSLNWLEGATYEYNNNQEVYDPLNVLYITLELSEELVSKRMDTMITGIDAREVFKRIDDVEMKVMMKGKKCGHLRVKYMPAGSTCNDIRAYLNEFLIQTQIHPDALIVDYLDLLHPNRRRIDPGDLFIKDKYVTEEMRALAGEYDILCATASQLNRSAVDESEHNQAMIAGGISKIQTADNVVSIYASHSMRERGEYQCQFLKTRSSSGVGSKVYLGFDITSLRIHNLAEDHESEDDDDEKPTLREKMKAEDIIKKAKRTEDVPTGITKSPEPEVEEKMDNDPAPEEDAEPEESQTERLKRLMKDRKL